MTPPLPPALAESGASWIPTLIVAEAGRRPLKSPGSWARRILFCERVAELHRLLVQEPVEAIIIETRDIDGAPVPAAIRSWVHLNPLVPVLVWTAGSDNALREILDLNAAGADVRLILRPRHDLTASLNRLFAGPFLPHPGAVPSLLNGIVVTAPETIQPELTLAAYHAWPEPRVRVWSESLGLTRQALNGRLKAAGYATASVIMDLFSAAEIAIRLTHGMRLREIAAAMGRPDERSLRRRLDRLACKPEQLRDEADFRALMPRIALGVRRGN
jgi:hypothetical protein